MAKKWKDIVYKKNRRAFNQVISEYLRRREKTKLPPLDLSYDSRGKVNPMLPNDADFFADCELAWESVIKLVSNDGLLFDFLLHYVIGHERLPVGLRKTLENKIGKEFIKRGIYPTRKYFERDKQ